MSDKIYVTDAEILQLFLTLVKSYHPKKLIFYVRSKSQKSQLNSELYNSVLDLSRLLLKYAK